MTPNKQLEQIGEAIKAIVESAPPGRTPGNPFSLGSLLARLPEESLDFLLAMGESQGEEAMSAWLGSVLVSTGRYQVHPDGNVSPL